MDAYSPYFITVMLF